MTTRLVLLCAGGTASARTGGFPDPAEPLDAGGWAKLRGLALGATGPCAIAPSRAAQDTAALLGLTGETVPALADIDHGDWTGRRLESIAPDALAAWFAAPEAGAPGGETLATTVARVAAWMDDILMRERHVLAITHAATIRAALAHALRVPPAATLGIDVAPLSTTMLSHHGRWRLQELRRA